MNPFQALPSPAYTVHKWALAIAAVCWVIVLVSANMAGVAAGGVAFIASGVAAIVGGRSLITSISGQGYSQEWSEQELSEMGPAARSAHALVTGGALIALGVTALAIVGMSVRNQALRHESQRLEAARGATTWRPDQHPIPLTYGAYGWYEAIAIGGDQICYSGSPLGRSAQEMSCAPKQRTLALGDLLVRRVRFSGGRLLWASEANVGIIQRPAL